MKKERNTKKSGKRLQDTTAAFLSDQSLSALCRYKNMFRVKAD
ncbi:hypothetical protein CHCC14820_3080 [Bacillus paralicheniformis]|uniref:Uncharacterized protein n=1 Tax=Bacillus paralicheniformis TaxID=1648923 RepID=A0A7Z1B3W7_9BACI|nr:hypothetical protein B4121_1363 [Bacillus paralicheniformis]TWK38685.1 hypothetical protein CHCC20347_3944 [Bacillus paralicheniformis]TWK88254.1 hypothetical protein CHCC20333_3383 [Bacillus paralicheniformis]TWM35425.1 hypothetical protein CHCC14820_3080 [Bacillus paralicheniformis]